MNKIAFITGVNGQDGAYLANFLLSKNYKVFGLLRDKHSNVENLKFFNIDSQIQYIYGDISNANLLGQVIGDIKPHEIYNLGGMTSPAESWMDLDNYVNTNINSVINIINGIRHSSPKTKLFQASTSEMFGNSNYNEGIQSEILPFQPTNPYAVTKLFGFWMTNIFKESSNLFLCNGILFNHESPLRGKKFVTRKISDGVARISLGLQENLVLGNLESRRDWGFAGDFVEAFYLILQQATPDNYILSTGHTHTIRDFLEIAFRYVGIYDWERYILIDQQFNRPINLMSLHGKNDKARVQLGWEPRVSFEDLVMSMVEMDIKRNTFS